MLPEAGRFVPVTVRVKVPVSGIWLGDAPVSTGLGALTAYTFDFVAVRLSVEVTVTA